MMANGDALFFIMGDWEIGTLIAAGHKPGEDILCGQAPNNSGKPGFILNSDSVVFFKQKDPDYVAGQQLLAHLILSPDFQTVFNIAKGSIPARMDVDLSKGFNACQQLSQKDLEASIGAGTLEAIAFGHHFISNPDLVKRLQHGQPLVEPDAKTFYSPGPRGYTDYPAYTA